MCKRLYKDLGGSLRTSSPVSSQSNILYPYSVTSKRAVPIEKFVTATELLFRPHCLTWTDLVCLHMC